MTSATIDRPVRATEMGRMEAEEITQAIKNNFDSLGAMLLQARDRKAYKALGYRSFDTYCKTEFGKSISSAYQLIEDVKVVAELEAEISKQYDEPVTLNFPSSHLRPLKELPGIGDKLKAIEYAQKLAIAEGKKPTKKHLEIAVFEISGKRSEDFRSAIQGLGFTKGTQVELTKSLKKDRGFVAKVDKRGKIYVQLHNGGAVPILCDASDLRILGDTEKPTIPASDDTANKGDKVKIFARGWEGQTGEIFTWQMGRHAMVKVDGEKVPVNIAYAELELLPDIQSNLNDWESNLKWSTTNNNYFFDSESDTIICNKWPAGLVLHPHHSELGPIDWMDKWENNHALGLLKSLFNPSQFKTLAVAQAIRLPEEERREFITDLIAGMVRLLPSQFKLEASSKTADTEALKAENQRLREQLAEAESAIEAIVDMAHEQIQILPEVEESTELLAEDAASTASPLEADESWLSVLESNNFTQIDETYFGETPTEIYREWTVYLYDHIVDIFHPRKGAFSKILSDHPGVEEEVAKPVEWLKNIINQIEDFCPGQLLLFPKILSFEDTFSAKTLQELLEKEKELLKGISLAEKGKGKTKAKELKNIVATIARKQLELDNLTAFLEFRINQRVTHKTHKTIGTVTGVTMSSGGLMPHVFIRWDESTTSIPELVNMLAILDL